MHLPKHPPATNFYNSHIRWNSSTSKIKPTFACLDTKCIVLINPCKWRAFGSVINCTPDRRIKHVIVDVLHQNIMHICGRLLFPIARQYRYIVTACSQSIHKGSIPIQILIVVIQSIKLIIINNVYSRMKVRIFLVNYHDF